MKYVLELIGKQSIENTNNHEECSVFKQLYLQSLGRIHTHAWLEWHQLLVFARLFKSFYVIYWVISLLFCLWKFNVPKKYFIRWSKFISPLFKFIPDFCASRNSVTLIFWVCDYISFKLVGSAVHFCVVILTDSSPNASFCSRAQDTSDETSRPDFAAFLHILPSVLKGFFSTWTIMNLKLLPWFSAVGRAVTEGFQTGFSLIRTEPSISGTYGIHSLFLALPASLATILGPGCGALAVISAIQYTGPGFLKSQKVKRCSNHSLWSRCGGVRQKPSNILTPPT